MAQTVSFTVLARSEQAAAELFLPIGASFEPFRFEQRVYEVQTPGPSMGFGSASASKSWSPPKGA